ncbi:AAA family ATPase [Haliea sp. E1-2-M8]|uniref:AAA family ATPase n=1 Tax=Haliea sp. E1-2-M8 TaxID=3064706 RepID=UPI00272454F6|nr:AAA family ATPase [Haliea sp. E1-2-M8]MDO8863259.1 AAA family ATPase [Haliea sp. E1-2-M8]
MPISQENFNKLGRYLETGHQLIRGIKTIAEDQMPPRRYKGEELVELVGAKSNTIYMAEKEGRLPPPDLDPKTHRRLGATLEQVLGMQEYFGTRPWRKPDEIPMVMSFTNFKGGCWKTTTSWYAGSYYANLGYRVLFVDLDPQASLTHNCGILPDFETCHEQSLGPFILEEEGFPASWAKNVIRDTHLPNLKIIPSTLQLAGVEYALSNAIMEARSETDRVAKMMHWFHRVKDTISEIKEDFDIVIMDGTPSLGLLPLNIIFASDAVIVPVPTEITDFASTLSFGDLYREQSETLYNNFGDDIVLPDMLFLPTRFSASEKTATLGSEFVLDQIRKTFGVDCMQSVIKKHEAVVSNLSLMRRTVFDVNAGDANVNREARKRAMANFQTVFDEILARVVYPRWPSKKAVLEEKGIY